MKENGPVEISKAEYYAIKKALTKKAQELINAHREEIPRPYARNLHLFFSDADRPCHYASLPKGFRHNETFGAQDKLLHFMPFPCSCSKQANPRNTEEVICLAKYKGKYYLNTHRIGRCTWKEA